MQALTLDLLCLVLCVLVRVGQIDELEQQISGINNKASFSSQVCFANTSHDREVCDAPPRVVLMSRPRDRYGNVTSGLAHDYGVNALDDGCGDCNMNDRLGLCLPPSWLPSSYAPHTPVTSIASIAAFSSLDSAMAFSSAYLKPNTSKMCAASRFQATRSRGTSTLSSPANPNSSTSAAATSQTYPLDEVPSVPSSTSTPAVNVGSRKSTQATVTMNQCLYDLMVYYLEVTNGSLTCN